MLTTFKNYEVLRRVSWDNLTFKFDLTKFWESIPKTVPGDVAWVPQAQELDLDDYYSVSVAADLCWVLVHLTVKLNLLISLNVAVSRDGSGDAVATYSMSGSPRSPRTGSGQSPRAGSCQPEKTMSAIAATHQTMTSLLSKPSLYFDHMFDCRSFVLGVIHKGQGGGGFQWKRTSAASAAHSTRISNRAGQTDVTDTSCTTAPALRQSWAISAETADKRGDSLPLPWHSTSVSLNDRRRTIGYVDTIPVWAQGGTTGAVDCCIVADSQQGSALGQRILCLSFATCSTGCSRHLLMLINLTARTYLPWFNINNWTVVNFCVLHAIFGQHYRFWPVLNRHYWVVMFSILGSDSLVRTSAWGRGCTSVDKSGQGGGGSILADILRTSCMDDPLYKRAYIWK